MKRKLVVVLLAMAMLLTYMPSLAYADADSATDEPIQSEQWLETESEADEPVLTDNQDDEVSGFESETPQPDISDDTEEAVPEQQDKGEPQESSDQNSTDETEDFSDEVQQNRNADGDSFYIDDEGILVWNEDLDVYWAKLSINGYDSEQCETYGPDYVNDIDVNLFLDQLYVSGDIDYSDSFEIFIQAENSNWDNIVYTSVNYEYSPGGYWDGTHYYYNSGYYAAGRVKIGSDNYFFDDDGELYTDTWISLGENADVWYHSDENGVLNGGWTTIDGDTYYFDPEYNYMYTGLNNIDDTYCYFDDDGIYEPNPSGWRTGKYGITYYFENGEPAQGWRTIGGKTYYFDPEMATGNKYIDGENYFFDSNGVLVDNPSGWKNVNGRWYYYENGNAATGWRFIGGKWYYFEDYSGIMVTGKWEIGGNWFYFAPGGDMKTGFIKEMQEDGNTVTYYADANGYLQFGWKLIGGKWYYFEPDSGVMYDDGWYYIGADEYCFAKGGAMRTGWIDITDSWVDDDGIKHSDTTWYYADSNGHLKYGWQSIGGKRYYLDPEYGYMYTGKWEIDGKWYIFASSGEMKTGWIQQIFKYQNEYEGPKAEISIWYYADANGYLQFGWKLIGGKWYYFDTDDGYMYCDREGYIDGSIYFFAKDGAMKTGWMSIPQGNYTAWFYLGSDGALKRGWQLIGGKWYYLDYAMATGFAYTGQPYGYCLFDSNGAFQSGTTGWIQPYKAYGNDNWAYVKNGYAQTGWQSINGHWYYFQNSGLMCRGAIEIDGTSYYFNSNGVWESATNGWKQSGGNWFYFKEGKPVTGWQTIGGARYYFEPIYYNEDNKEGYGGWMYTGVQYVEEDSRYYYFNSSGALEPYATKWVKSYEDWYYFENGEMVTGWKTIGNKRYYFEPGGGWMYSGPMYVYEDSRYYCFGSDGALTSDATRWAEKWGYWYYFEKGDAATGWRLIGGKWYYFEDDCAMKTGWLELNDKWYYFNSNGAMLTGTQTINGKTYTFTPNGEWNGK